MLLVGVLGLYWHRRLLEPRFSLVFGSVALVGIGSAAFHATLRFELQMLDELPMLYTAVLLVYILVEDRPRRRFGAWFPTLLTGYALLASYGAAFMRDRAQFFSFQASFTLLEFYALYRTFCLYKRSERPVLRRAFRTGSVLYLAAMLAWFVDLRFCEQLVGASAALGIANPQLHAWWHVLVSGGLYLLLLVILHERLLVLGREPRWEKRFFVPMLSVTPAA